MIMESFFKKYYNECEYCLLRHMKKTPFTWNYMWGKDMLDLVYTNKGVPFVLSTRDAQRHFVTFTDDLSRCG